MKKLSVLVALLVILTVGVLPVAAITGGDPDGSAHPNVGAMLVDVPDMGFRPVCSGTLIHPRVFLTAGHCTDYVATAYPGQAVAVVFAEDLSVPSPLWFAKDVVTHPEYKWGPTSNPHDVGVLILENPVGGIVPEDLPDPFFLHQLKAQGKLRQGRNRATFVVVGYGALVGWPPSQIFSPDGLRRSAESEFLTLLKAWLVMSQNQAPARDDGGTCYGDSGGPAFYLDPDTEEETLVGITSWGDSQCAATGMNYRVDIPDTLDFIDDVIDDL